MYARSSCAGNVHLSVIYTFTNCCLWVCYVDAIFVITNISSDNIKQIITKD